MKDTKNIINIKHKPTDEVVEEHWEDIRRYQELRAYFEAQRRRDANNARIVVGLLLIANLALILALLNLWYH